MKKQRALQGINRWKHDVIHVEYSSIFKLDVPEKLKLGKNVSRLAVNKDILLGGSSVYIDILDSNSNSIYYEVSNIVDSSDRRIIIYIYPDTISESCEIYISGTLIDGKTILFKKKIQKIDITEVTDSEIVFKKTPLIKLTERLESIQRFSGISRLVTTPGTGSISIVSVRMPRQFENDKLTVEKEMVDSIFSTNLPTHITGSSNLNYTVQIPKYSEYSILSSKNFSFSSSMVGGKIYVKNLQIDYPKDAINPSIFTGKIYNSNIIDIINTSSIKVYPPYRETFEYETASGKSYFTSDRFFNQTDFTTSYYQDLSIQTGINESQSFATIDIFDCETDSGFMDSVYVSYKPINSFGDFIPIGNFKINSVDVMTSTSSVQFDIDGVREKSIGVFKKSIGVFKNGLTDVHTYWTSQSFGTGSLSITQNSSRILDGIRISYVSTRSMSNYSIIKPKKDYGANVFSNTIYNLVFDSYCEPDSVNDTSQIDIYISGSIGSDVIGVNKNPNLPQNPIVSASLGKYIGSVTSRNGILQKNAFEFQTLSSGSVYPIISLRTGIWNIGNIELKSLHGSGYNSNHIRLQAPIDSSVQNTELIFKIEYLDAYGRKSNFNSTINGVYFRGIDSSTDVIRQQNLNSYKETFIHRKQLTFSNAPSQFTVSFPLFQTTQSVIYTGSKHNVGIIFTVQTLLYGVTGSNISTIDSYVWASTLQCRASVNSSENAGRVLFYTPIILSGSSVFSQGTYGNGPVAEKTNIDSWLLYNGISATPANGALEVTYRITGTSSYEWSGYVTSTCESHKYEITYA